MELVSMQNINIDFLHYISDIKEAGAMLIGSDNLIP